MSEIRSFNGYTFKDEVARAQADRLSDEIKNTSISVVVNDAEITKIDGGFVNATANGQIASIATYFYTELFPLSKGEKIIVTSADPSGSAVARISKWQSEGTFEKTISVGTVEETTAEYTATEDVEYIRFSGYSKNSFVVKHEKVVPSSVFDKVVRAIANESNEANTSLSVSMFSEIALCGDSYTAGAICTKDSALGTLSVLGYAPYGNILARMTGCNVTTYASSGADTKSYQTRAECLPQILTDTPKELYLFALGINDRDNQNIELGTLSDIKEDYAQNADTFYGNYGKIIAQVKAHAPSAKIVLSTVFIPAYLNGVYYEYSANAVKEIAEHFGVMFVDAKDVAFLSSYKYNADIAANGAHPTAPTYSAIAKAVKYLIDKCMENNIDYFNSFIPQNA